MREGEGKGGVQREGRGGKGKGGEGEGRGGVRMERGGREGKGTILVQSGYYFGTSEDTLNLDR